MRSLQSRRSKNTGALCPHCIEQHNGRVVDSPGDNLLAEFASAVDAVQCAVEIQKQLKKENDRLVEDKRLEFRIGVNIGDVVQDEDRIYGDGVNIAARIEGLADPAGICVSRSAYDQIKKKLGFGFEYMGEHPVKNISEPVRVYKVLMDSEDIRTLTEKKKKVPKLKWILAAAAVSIVIVVGALGGVYWKYFYLPTPMDIDPQNKMAFDLPNGPSIAVLPFDNISGDPEQEIFCDGVTENLISALAHIRQLFVIARNSTFAYKGKPVNIQQIGHDLGADNIIEGSVQKSGDQIRITVQLIDAKTGHHKWSEIYNRKMEDFFSLQDEITIEIVKAIGINLTEGEEFRTKFGDIDDLQVYIKSLEAWKHFHLMNSEGMDQARKEILEILDSGYQYSSLYALLGFTYTYDLFFRAYDSKVVCFGKATEAAKKALSLDKNCVKAHELVGFLFVMKGEDKKGIDEFKRALTISSSSADAYIGLGWVYALTDKPLEAMDYVKKAFLLNPMPPVLYYMISGAAYTFTGEYEKSNAEYRKGLDIEPNTIFLHIGLTTNYALLGREVEAKTSASDVLKIDPEFSLDDYLKTFPKRNIERKEKIAQALRKAGLPD